MNGYGLDSRYFKEKLGQIVRDADNYTPQEMSLAFDRLKAVADQSAADSALKHLDSSMQTHSFD